MKAELTRTPRLDVGTLTACASFQNPDVSLTAAHGHPPSVRLEEGGVVVRGRVELTVGGETTILESGDAYYFDSRIPHRFRNIGTEEAEIVSACSPPAL